MIGKCLFTKLNQVNRIQRCNFTFRFRRHKSETFQKNYRSYYYGSNGGFRWNQSWRSKRVENVFYVAGIWTTFKEMFSRSQPRLDEDEVKHNIKMAMWYVMEKRYDEAFEVLHVALRLARERKDYSAENYVLDMLANVYYQKGDLEPAERLFVEVMRRLISTGTPQNNPAIIEISLKLSEIYASKGEHEKAEVGYQFCITSARAHISEEHQTSDNKGTLKPIPKSSQAAEEVSTDQEVRTDPYALYGIALETYAQYLVGRSKVEQSLEYLKRALELSDEIYGPSNGHSIVMMNNFASVCLRNNSFETALKYMTEVVTKSEALPELASQLPGFYCNYAEALWHCKQSKKALDYAVKAVSLAKEQDNEDMLNYCDEFLRQLQTDSKKVEK